MSTTPFDWHGENVVVEEQAAIAVYENVHGGIVIRQEGDWHSHEDDVVIVVRPGHAAALAKAILALAEELGAAESPAPQLALPAPKKTAAERQRRYRNAKRDGGDVTDRDATVTRNGAATVTPILQHNGVARR